MRKKTLTTRTTEQYKRAIHKVMFQVNQELAQIHKSLFNEIDQEKYFYATEFAEQYISYTSIWNIKFQYNLESPEVAAIQILHLEYIFEQEESQQFQPQRAIFNDIAILFNEHKPYTDQMMSLRRQKMLDYIHTTN